MEDCIGADEEENADSHHQWPEHFEIVRVQVIIQEVTQEATVTGGVGGAAVRMALV